jgi:hypothetical protein
MELRLRFFSGRSILFAFRVLQAYGKIDQNREYWMEKAFLYIFKNPQYFFTPTEYAEILRSVIMMGIVNILFNSGQYSILRRLLCQNPAAELRIPKISGPNPLSHH